MLAYIVQLIISSNLQVDNRFAHTMGLFSLPLPMRTDLALVFPSQITKGGTMSRPSQHAHLPQPFSRRYHLLTSTISPQPIVVSEKYAYRRSRTDPPPYVAMSQQEMGQPTVPFRQNRRRLMKYLPCQFPSPPEFWHSFFGLPAPEFLSSLYAGQVFQSGSIENAATVVSSVLDCRQKRIQIARADLNPRSSLRREKRDHDFLSMIPT